MRDIFFKKWIFGTSLRTATILIGVSSLMLGVVAFYTFIICLAKVSLKRTGLGREALLTYAIVTMVVGIPSGGLLIAGAAKEKPKLLFIGMILHCIVALIDGFTFMVGGGLGINNTDNLDKTTEYTEHPIRLGYSKVVKHDSPKIDHTGIGVFNIFFGIALLSIFGAYFVFVIYSFRIKLKLLAKPQPMSTSEQPEEQLKVVGSKDDLASKKSKDDLVSEMAESHYTSKQTEESLFMSETLDSELTPKSEDQPPSKTYVDELMSKTYDDRFTPKAYGQPPSNTYEEQQPSNTYEEQQPSNTYEQQQPSNTYEQQQPSNTYEQQQPSNTYANQFVSNMPEEAHDINVESLSQLDTPEDRDRMALSHRLSKSKFKP